MRLRAVLAVGLSVVACGGGGAPSDTDCVTPDSVAEQVVRASIVIVGTVTNWDGIAADLEVEEVWRGPSVPALVEVVPEPGRVFSEGTKYLAFPTDWPPPLGDARCSATTRWDDSLAAYRPTTVRAPAAAPIRDPDLPWEWVLLGAAIFGGLAMARHAARRWRHPEPSWDPDFLLEDERGVER